MPRAASSTVSKRATKTANEKTTKPAKPKAEPKTKRAPSAYNIFVKENMAKWREDNPDKSHKEAMSGIGAMWKDAPENPNRGKETKTKKKAAGKTEEKEPSSSDTEA